MAMSERAKELRRAYKRAWAKRNPDKIKAMQERYWNKRAEREEGKNVTCGNDPEI